MVKQKVAVKTTRNGKTLGEKSILAELHKKDETVITNLSSNKKGKPTDLKKNTMKTIY